MEYPVGTKVQFFKFSGEVVENTKFPGDICIKWDTQQVISYDQEWLDHNVKIIKD